MTVDPVQIVRAQRPDIQNVSSILRTSGIKTSVAGIDVDFSSIPMRPDHPGWREKIPPPEPDVSPKAEADDREKKTRRRQKRLKGREAMVYEANSKRTVILSFGPKEGEVIVSVEEAPEWDVVASARVEARTVCGLLPVLRSLAKVRDLTGGYLEGARGSG